MEDKKYLAINLYQAIAGDHDLKDVAKKYLVEPYTQHNADVGDGIDAFLNHFKSFKKAHPDLQVTVLRSIIDKEFMYCYAVQWFGGKPAWITNDIFRLTKDNKAIEHWDTIAAAKESLFWTAQTVGGGTEITDCEKTAENKKMIEQFHTDLVDHNTTKFDDYFLLGFTQHAPEMLGVSVESWKKLIDDKELKYDEPFKLIGEGNFVLAFGKLSLKDVDYAAMSLYRIEKGRIMEHWLTAETLNPNQLEINSGKF